MKTLISIRYSIFDFPKVNENDCEDIEQLRLLLTNQIKKHDSETMIIYKKCFFALLRKIIDFDNDVTVYQYEQLQVQQKSSLIKPSNGNLQLVK